MSKDRSKTRKLAKMSRRGVMRDVNGVRGLSLDGRRIFVLSCNHVRFEDLRGFVAHPKQLLCFVCEVGIFAE